MALQCAKRWLTTAVLLTLAAQQRQAFTIQRPDVTLPHMDLAAAASEQLEATEQAGAENIAVLHITTRASTTNPIETTAKTEEIQKNTSQETVPTNKGNSDSVVTKLYGTTDRATETTTGDTSTDIVTTSVVKSLSVISGNQTEITPIVTEHTQSVKTPRETNESDLNAKTQAGNAMSYPTKLVKNTTVEASTAINANDSDSSNVTHDTTGSNGEDETATSMPYWKKYTMIDRKRLNEEYVATTEKDEDLVKAAQSHISLEKAFSISSDIPSLEKLKNDLFSLNSKIPTKSPDVTTTVTEAMLPTEISTQPAATDSTEDSSLQPRVDTMSSMRAGYLDYSSRMTNDVKTTATETVLSSTGKPDTNDTTTTVTPTTKANSNGKTGMDENISGAASQSQLAEDAINEELLKESIIREQSDKTDRENVTSKPNVIEGGAELSEGKTSSEDSLSVKPISAEKKTTLLYTVSPNYKPMKKIEVQPPKTFARDPDDNSWRNESLSSLGIVFKANNSTKPFTQVLKNKTETELNSLLDKYNKSSEQELRERLAKMSEKRKSKRKKVDKNGDVTYVDYEESNSGETSTKPAIYQVPYIPPLFEVSPLPTPQLKQSIFSFNSSAFDLELNKTKQDNMTRNKKVIETFDGDDDDGEYISVSDIDIKKYMSPGKTTFTSPPPLPRTPPLTTVSHFPERKPTVQYFPPLQKQKTTLNEYDDSFRNKVNSFTLKETPKNYPTPFTTPLPSAGQFGQRIHTTGTTHIPRSSQDLHKSVYLTNQGDNGFGKGAYVIKHLKDFIEDAVKVEEDPSGYVPPIPVFKPTPPPKPSGDYFDYDAHFRKNIIDRFVENFNAQNEKFKVDFPVIYNSSVVHNADSGREASSSAFMRRLFDDARAAKANLYHSKIDPNCDRTVELSPAYELHYYVPGEEEKQDPPVEPRPLVPYRYPGYKP